MRQFGNSIFFEINSKSIGHPIEGPTVNAKDFRSVALVMLRLLQDMKQVAFFQFIQAGQVIIEMALVELNLSIHLCREVIQSDDASF